MNRVVDASQTGSGRFILALEIVPWQGTKNAAALQAFEIGAHCAILAEARIVAAIAAKAVRSDSSVPYRTLVSMRANAPSVNVDAHLSPIMRNYSGMTGLIVDVSQVTSVMPLLAALFAWRA